MQQQQTTSQGGKPDVMNMLLAERGAQYGETWKLASQVFQLLIAQAGLPKLITGPLPFFHNWMLILSKLIRCWYSPENVDHWKDIEGYARLCRLHLEPEGKPLPTQEPRNAQGLTEAQEAIIEEARQEVLIASRNPAKS